MYEQGFYAWEETLKHNAYILMCQLLAMENFGKLAYFSDAPDLVNDLLSAGDPELNKNIMSLAALARANDDSRSGLAQHSAQHPNGVGTLTQDGNDAVLTAREACNKLIHSKSSSLTFESTTEHPLYAEAYRLNGIEDDEEYRIPFLTLRGERQNGREWVARVNMVQWIFAVAGFGA